MRSIANVLNRISVSGTGVTLAELLAKPPDMARRTVERQVAQLIEGEQITAVAEGRARRYFRAGTRLANASGASTDAFPGFIPLAADGLDVMNT